MDFSTLLLGALMALLPLVGAGLLGIMVMLERPEPLTPAPADGPAPRRPRPRRRR
jgi:hypothetical protein